MKIVPDNTDNPLPLILQAIPPEGIILTPSILSNISNIFRTSSIFPENRQDTLKILVLLKDFYNLWSIDFKPNVGYLLIKNG